MLHMMFLIVYNRMKILIVLFQDIIHNLIIICYVMQVYAFKKDVNLSQLILTAILKYRID